MTSFIIESDVPLPQDPRGAKQKYPFANMHVGDSFAFPARPDAYGKSFNKVRQAAYNYIRRIKSGLSDGQKAQLPRFAFRRTAVNCGRCWRIA